MIALPIRIIDHQDLNAFSVHGQLLGYVSPLAHMGRDCHERQDERHPERNEQVCFASRAGHGKSSALSTMW